MKYALLGLTLLACKGSTTDEPTDTAPLARGAWASLSVADAEASLADFQVLDTRSRSAYDTAHLPGALHLDASDLRTTVDGVSGQAISRSNADTLFRIAGLDGDKPILVYGAENDTSTARVLWSLAYFGANEDLRLLDGGVEAWEAASFTTEQSTVPVTELPWSGSASRSEILVDKTWVLDHLDDPDVVFFDVRSAAEYTDGHIPGATNVEWVENIRNNGLFHDRTVVLENHGNPAAPTVIVYCQSGARASVSWSLLTFAGLPDVRLYDGSWNEWGTDMDTPKVTGSQP